MHAVRDTALVIAEMETGDLRPIEEWGCDAQWGDELHHAVHVLVSGEREGYYADYGTVSDVAREFERADARRLVVCAQNHDQVGNRAFGDRLHGPRLRLAAFCSILAPGVPLLFMGEEYDEQHPFQFFADHIDPAIARATREGRRKEFAKFADFADEEVPDPGSPETFLRSRLDPATGDDEHRDYYRRLLELRRELPAGPVRTVADEENRVPARLARRRGTGHELLRRGAAGCGCVGGTSSMNDVWPGRPFPLGAVWDGEGTNFAVFSEHAEGVELCLFDAEDRETRITVPERTGSTGTATSPASDRDSGTRTGSTVRTTRRRGTGSTRASCSSTRTPRRSTDPSGTARRASCRTSPTAKTPTSCPTRKTTRTRSPSRSWCPSTSTGRAIGCRRHPWNETIIYEAHVKGFTRRHPRIREDLRGTYAGSPPRTRSRTWSTSVSPQWSCCRCTTSPTRPRLVDKGLSNYWGYSSIGFLAPHSRVRRHGPSRATAPEFKGMVKALHAANIEVILDVVYNHTAEGNHLGPMLSFRGIDNASYYRLSTEDPRYYVDYTGTGNSLNPVSPNVLRLIMDSLRYFVIECHVDGFRFDLASALAREFHEVNRLSAFFDIVFQDPVLSQVKLIAEPWDVGEGGYQVGNFPVLWTEWNGPYRDTIRDYWRGVAPVGEFATRFAGSADLYERDGRRPFASINFVTAHDGFTLADLVSYNDKHNEANLEDNATAPTTTGAGTAASRDRPTTPTSSRCGPASSATSSRPCSSRRACRCCSPATSSVGVRVGTTTRTARTTRSRGSTGISTTPIATCTRSRRRLHRVPPRAPGRAP